MPSLLKTWACLWLVPATRVLLDNNNHSRWLSSHQIITDGMLWPNFSRYLWKPIVPNIAAIIPFMTGKWNYDGYENEGHFNLIPEVKQVTD